MYHMYMYIAFLDHQIKKILLTSLLAISHFTGQFKGTKEVLFANNLTFDGV